MSSLAPLSARVLEIAIEILDRDGPNGVAQLSDDLQLLLEDLRRSILDDTFDKFMDAIPNHGLRINVACDLAQKVDIQGPERCEKRSKPKLLAWFGRNWQHIKPVLPRLVFADENHNPIDLGIDIY